MKPAEYNDDELNPALAGVAPKLSSIEKKEVFSVPANYFDSLPDQIMDKITAAPAFAEGDKDSFQSICCAGKLF